MGEEELLVIRLRVPERRVGFESSFFFEVFDGGSRGGCFIGGDEALQVVLVVEGDEPFFLFGRALVGFVAAVRGQASFLHYKLNNTI